MRAPYIDAVPNYTDYQSAQDPSAAIWPQAAQPLHHRNMIRQPPIQMSEPREMTIIVPRAWSTRSSSDVGQADSGLDSIGESLLKPSKCKKGSKKGRKDSQSETAGTPQLTYKVKFKTELCKNFQLQGTCRFGDACCYAHGQHELRDKKHLNSNYKSKICKHFHGQGGCPYGLR